MPLMGPPSPMLNRPQPLPPNGSPKPKFRSISTPVNPMSRLPGQSPLLPRQNPMLLEPSLQIRSLEAMKDIEPPPVPAEKMKDKEEVEPLYESLEDRTYLTMAEVKEEIEEDSTC